MSGKPAPKCQSCGAPLTQTLVDLGLSPLANSYLLAEDLAKSEPRYPLHARVCHGCWLVQVESVVPAAEIFGHYAYFSSYSETWLAHCERYAEAMIARFGLSADCQVIEIASNDGYLLQFFAKRGISVLGIEPAENVAEAAKAKGVPTRVAFFGRETAQKLKDENQRPDLIAAKNVLAHVPDINDFVAGLAILLNGDAVFTVEFPHLLNLIAEVQFDTIYHEHYSYLSLLAVERIFARHGLRVFDVEPVPTHGGSLRVFACLEHARHEPCPGVQAVREREAAARLDNPAGYEGFEPRVQKVRDDLLEFLQTAKREGKRVAAYGAAAKGNTLLNYCGIGPELVAYAVDRNPMKQNTFLPGSRIPVSPVERLESELADYILVLPWNLRDEIAEQLAPVRRMGSKLVTAIPKMVVD